MPATSRPPREDPDGRARWCFLNFGFAKTAFEDISRRAGISRTLLYRSFKNKEEIYQSVFVDWLVSRQHAAKEAANGPGSACSASAV